MIVSEDDDVKDVKKRSKKSKGRGCGCTTSMTTSKILLRQNDFSSSTQKIMGSVNSLQRVRICTVDAFPDDKDTFT